MKFKKKNVKTLFNLVSLLAVLLTILALFACEDNAFDPDDDSPQGNGGGDSGSIEIVSTAAELPACGTELKGEMYYVQDSGELTLCDGSEYKVMNANTDNDSEDPVYLMSFYRLESILYYTAPDGVQYTLDLGDGLSKLGGSEDFSDYSPNDYIAYEPGDETHDAALYFNISGAPYRCTLLHSEDDYPRAGLYFSTDMGNAYHHVWGTTEPDTRRATFALKSEGVAAHVIGHAAGYTIFCR